MPLGIISTLSKCCSLKKHLWGDASLRQVGDSEVRRDRIRADQPIAVGSTRSAGRAPHFVIRAIGKTIPFTLRFHKRLSPRLLFSNHERVSTRCTKKISNIFCDACFLVILVCAFEVQTLKRIFEKDHK